MSVLDQFTDEQLEKELIRRREVRLNEWRLKVGMCRHEYDGPYHDGIGRICKHCGALGGG